MRKKEGEKKIHRRHKAATIIMLLCVLLFSSLTGCGKSEEELYGGDVTLVKVAFWGSPEKIEIITECIKDWEEYHPGIKVRFEHTPYGGYVSKILTRIAGNAAPDIIATEVDYFVTFSTENVLHDLTPYIKNDPSFALTDFFPEVVDRFTRNNNVYAIPVDTAPFACVFYNKDIFDQAGVAYPTDDWTWEDMLEKAQALMQHDEKGRVERYGFYGWAWQNFIYGNGANLVDDTRHPTRCTLDDPLALEGLQFYADLINKYKVMPTPVALSNAGMGVDYMFASGRLAMFLSGIWEAPSFRNYDFNWDVAMFPKNSRGIRRFGTGGSGYAILESSEKKDAAWEVIKALTSQEAQRKIAQAGLAQPARIAVAESEAFAGHPDPPANKGMLNKAIKYVVYDPFHIKWREAQSRYLIPALDLVKNGKKTAKEAIESVLPQINKTLQEE